MFYLSFIIVVYRNNQLVFVLCYIECYFLTRFTSLPPDLVRFVPVLTLVDFSAPSVPPNSDSASSSPASEAATEVAAVADVAREAERMAHVG
jgi:hypothetical protein